MVLAPVIEMARLVTPTMVKQGSGAFVNVTTFAAYEPPHIFPASCTYRAAVGAFTWLFADRYAAGGIRMNAVLPCFTDRLGKENRAYDDSTRLFLPLFESVDKCAEL